VTGLLGSITEAWGEVRVHKARVVLSLVGVFLAVLAMTTVTALGQIAAQVQQEEAERSGGRTATIGVQAYDPMTGTVPADEWAAGVAALVSRYGLPSEATDFSALTAPVLGHYGESDQSIPVEAVRATAERIRAQSGVEPELHVYPAGHAFYNDERPSYDRESAELAWGRTTTFLRSHLG